MIMHPVACVCWAVNSTKTISNHPSRLMPRNRQCSVHCTYMQFRIAERPSHASYSISITHIHRQLWWSLIVVCDACWKWMMIMAFQVCEWMCLEWLAVVAWRESFIWNRLSMFATLRSLPNRRQRCFCVSVVASTLFAMSLSIESCRFRCRDIWFSHRNCSWINSYSRAQCFLRLTPLTRAQILRLRAFGWRCRCY